MLKMAISLFAMVLIVAAGCGSNSIYVGNTKLSEHSLRLLLTDLPGTVALTSAHESDYIIKEGSAAYPRIVVVTPGETLIAGKLFMNSKPIILDITSEDSFAAGETKEIGNNYFVYVLPSAIGKNFEAVISNHNPDWIGYYSPGAGRQPRGYSSKTWRLLGYFHVGPQGGVIRNSVVTNYNLNNPQPGVPLPGMVKVGDFAIDIYENSDLNGHCISAFGRTPITNITCDEAQLIAIQSGKRLPTSKQWFEACDPESFPQVLNMKPQEGEGPQNVWSGQIALTGHFASQTKGNTASSGCVDMVGNVWEWCDEIIDFSEIKEMPVDKAGYITETQLFMDIPFWPSVITQKGGVESLGYFFLDTSLEKAGIARGASCDDKEKAGTASLLLELARHQTSSKVGFRCVR